MKPLTPVSALSVFVCAAPCDAAHRRELEIRLAPLAKEGIIELVAGPQPGDHMAYSLRDLEMADVVIPLLSADLLAGSDPVTTSLHEIARSQPNRSIMPVMLRPCNTSFTPFHERLALPSTNTAVTAWPNMDEAWTDVQTRLYEILSKLYRQRTMSTDDASTGQLAEDVYTKKLGLRQFKRDNIILDRYVLDELVERWDNVNAWTAQDQHTGKQVLFMVNSDYYKTEGGSQFLAACRAASRVDSPFVLRLLSIVRIPEPKALIFEWGRGQPLSKRMSENAIPPQSLAPLAYDAMRGLRDIHRARLLHGSINPRCLFIQSSPTDESSLSAHDWRTEEAGRMTMNFPRDRMKLWDFCHSVRTAAGPNEGTSQADSELHSNHLWRFMPPELRQPSLRDESIDLYALATTLFMALIQEPFQVQNILGLYAKNKFRTLSEATGTPWPSDLEAFFARALAKDPHARYLSASDMAAAWLNLATWDRR
jgi:serine/threonine protein kinase